MKIAIYNSKGSFSERWVSYCEKNNINYKLINPYDSDIVHQVSDCDAFMWHHSHINYKDCLFAKQLLFSLSIGGMKIFPNTNSGMLFDDKVGEKYLLESIGAPTVPSYVFYTKKEAFAWIKQTTFPKVFKLRRGAGSLNVMLVHSAAQARKFVKKAFGNGFSQYSAWNRLKDRMRKYRSGKADLKDVLKGIAHLFLNPKSVYMLGNEKGYVYFQEFIPNNTFDIRIIVVGDKAFGIKRLCRKRDFRASGSGSVVFLKNQIDERCVQIAFSVSEKISSQSMSYDFIFDKDNNPLIVEMSYCYVAELYDKCEGYWDRQMNWHHGEQFDFCGWMVEEIIKEVNN